MIPDTSSLPPVHGGDLDWAERRFGRPAQGWIDLSTGINPWPYPVPVLPAEAWTRLPGRTPTDRLIAAAARCYGVPDPDTIVAAPGTQSLIRLLPSLWPNRRVAVLGPTYTEHAASWRDGGHQVVDCADLSDAAERGDIVVVTNPNNPDGRRLAPDTLNHLVDDLSARGGTLIVDEAFADLCPDLSLAATAGKAGRVILRSFGKFYGLAGVRLGFAIAERALARKINHALGPWAVSGPAMAVGTRALSDAGWADEMRQRLGDAGVALRTLLQAAGFEIVGGTDLFVLAAHPDAAARFERLGEAGIYVRRFTDQPGRLRFGLPPDAEAEARLAAAL